MTPSNVNENDALYRRIRLGDQSAVAEMIECNVPLVRSRVGAFLKDYRRFKYLFDDLVSEGNLALTRVVNSFSSADIEKPTGRIVSEIDYALSNYIDSEIGAGTMCGRTVQRYRAAGEHVPEQLSFDVADPPAYLWNTAELNPKVSEDDAGELISRYEVADNAPESDLLDMILGCCESEEEKTIVRLREQGITDKDIAERLGISRATVGRRRNAIEKRFDERMKKARQ